MKVVRIIPVEYSLVIISTPSTPMASCAISSPTRLKLVGSKVNRSSGLTPVVAA